MTTPRIGLTSFIDYFVAQSSTKVSRVRAAKRMMDGDGFDHWLLLRRAAVEALVAGGDKAVVRAAIQSASPRQAKTYAIAGDSLVRWIGRKKITASALPHGQVWNGPGLSVSVNPELRLSLATKGDMHLKLYFKSDVLSKRAADPMIRLIEKRYGDEIPAAILDVQRCRLHLGPAPAPADLDLLLDAEAGAFATIWGGL